MSGSHLAGMLPNQGPDYPEPNHVDIGGSAGPAALFSGMAPAVGMLTVPETLAYVWIALMCRKLYAGEKD